MMPLGFAACLSKNFFLPPYVYLPNNGVPEAHELLHPLSEVYEGLSYKSFVCLNCKAGPVTIRHGGRIAYGQRRETRTGFGLHRVRSVSGSLSATSAHHRPAGRGRRYTGVIQQFCFSLRHPISGLFCINIIKR